VLRLLGAALLTGAIEEPATAAPKRRQACRKVGKRCSQAQRCCAGARCLRARCRCQPGRKPCAGACIPRRVRCVPPGGGPGRIPPTCPPNTLCCSPGQKPCFGSCIPSTACCAHAECVGECRSGPCLNGTCAPAQRGTPCGPNGERRCDSDGACVRYCTVEGDCSQPPDTDVGFCRKAVCNDSACEEAAKEDGTVLPDRFQIPGDCKLRICVNNLPNGIGDDVTPDDIPGDAGPCFEGYCHDHVPSQRPRLAGHPCPNGTCNAQGSCV
jgi:hypothetical protein